MLGHRYRPLLKSKKIGESLNGDKNCRIHIKIIEEVREIESVFEIRFAMKSDHQIFYKKKSSYKI